MPVIHESSSLDPSARPTLSRARTSPTPSRASTTNGFGGDFRDNSGTSTPRTGRRDRRLSLTEKIAILEANPVDRGPWHPDSAYHIPRKSLKDLRSELLAQDADYKRRKEIRHLRRQLDRSRSRSNSLTSSAYGSNLSRVNSFRSVNSTNHIGSSSRFSSLKHSETASTVSSVPSSVSGRSTRHYDIDAVAQNDRVTQRLDTQEQQLRKLGDGKICQQDPSSNGGPGQRGLFGRNKGKNSR